MLGSSPVLPQARRRCKRCETELAPLLLLAGRSYVLYFPFLDPPPRTEMSFSPLAPRPPSKGKTHRLNGREIADDEMTAQAPAKGLGRPGEATATACVLSRPGRTVRPEQRLVLKIPLPVACPCPLAEREGQMALRNRGAARALPHVRRSTLYADVDGRHACRIRSLCQRLLLSRKKAG